MVKDKELLRSGVLELGQDVPLYLEENWPPLAPGA